MKLLIRTPANPLILCDGFRPDYLKTCSMHTVHLGVLQYHNGSIFTLLDELGFWAYKNMTVYIYM